MTTTYCTDDSDNTGVLSLTGGSSAVTQLGSVPANHIDLPSLRAALFPAPRVIPEARLTLDQQVTAAYSRLHVSIDANSVYASKHVARSFKLLRIELAMKFWSYGSIAQRGCSPGVPPASDDSCGY